MKRITLILLSLVVAVYSYNHPEIEWKTVTSKNFKIIYNESTEPALYASWKIAEEAYEQYKRLYRYPEGQKINLILADEDDYSNGLASWTDNTVKIWVTDLKFNLRDMNVWLRDVIYHEVGHIMSMEKSSRMQLLYWMAGGAYYSEDLNIEYIEPIARYTFMPMWFAEGTAQLRSDEMGGDCRDSRREMVLRDAAMNNALLSLDEMGHFTHDMVGNELVYNQGYSFTKYLEGKFGKKNIAAIWNRYKDKKFTGKNFAKIFLEVFQKSLENEYNNWKNEILKEAKNDIKDNNGHLFYNNGKINQQVKVSSDGSKTGLLSSRKDDFGRTDLLILDSESKKVLKRINYVRSDWGFSKDGNTVYYIQARKPNDNGSYFNDLFSYNFATGEEDRLTKNQRIYDFSFGEDGKSLYAVSYRKSRFEFIEISLSDKKVTYIDSPDIGEGYLTVNGNGSKMVLTRLLHGKASVYLFDCDSKSIKPVLQNDAHEEDAVMGTDGRIYYSADYDGITNIYSVDINGKNMKKHTSVQTGAFYPFYDGSNLWYSKYENRRFRIYNEKLSGVDFNITELPDCKYPDNPKPKGKVNISASDYIVKTGRSVWNGLTFLSLSDYDDALQDMALNRETDSAWDIGLDLFFGVNMFKSDPLEKKIVYGGVTAVIGTIFQDSSSNESDNLENVQSLRFANEIQSRISSQKKFHKDVKINGVRQYLNNKFVQKAEEDSTNDNATFPGYFVAVPYWGVESRSYKPTLGIDVEVQLTSMVPYGFYSYPFVDFQLGRDIHAGFSPMISLYPIHLVYDELREGAFAADMPLWLNWIHTNSINEDMQYNLGGVSFFEIFAGPQVSPQIELMDGDTIVESSLIFKAGLSAAHFFPVLKYSSFSVGGGFQCMISNRAMNSSTGTWLNDALTSLVDTVESQSLIAGIFSSDLTFPVIRNINRGSLYLDNLYGGIHYTLSSVASGKFLENGKSDLITDKNFYSPNAYCDHKIGVSLSLGFIKDYMFERRLQLILYRNLFAEETGVDLQITF